MPNVGVREPKMDVEEFAKDLWKALYLSLDDRGCFNGIDEETLIDLAKEQVETIKGAIAARK